MALLITGRYPRALFDYLAVSSSYTVQPKSILVIGQTRQLKTRTHKATLERFRRNLWNPEAPSLFRPV